MSSPNPGDVGAVIKVAVVGKLFEQLIVNTHFYRTIVTSDNSAPLGGLGNDFKALWLDNAMSVLASDYTLTRIECSLIVNPGDPAVRVDTTGEDAPGDVTTSTSLPPAVAVTVRKRTAYIGRRYRGRMRLAGIPMGSTSMGQLLPSPGTAILGAMAATLLGNPNTADLSWQLEPVLVGRDPENTSVYPIGRRVTAITSVDVDAVLRSQRRREVGVGA